MSHWSGRELSELPLRRPITCASSADRKCPPAPDYTAAPVPLPLSMRGPFVHSAEQWTAKVVQFANDLFWDDDNPDTTQQGCEGAGGAAAHDGPWLATKEREPLKMGEPVHVKEWVLPADGDPMPFAAEGLSSHRESLEMPLSMDVPITTLMVRNIHGRLRQEQVLEIWPSPQDIYDLFYMPYEVGRKRTAGYAFINFATPENAMAFRALWHGRPFPCVVSTSGSSNGTISSSSSTTTVSKSQNPIEIRPAVRQGFDANIEFWIKSLPHLPDDSVQPAVFLRGRRYAFWTFVHYMVYAQCEKASELTIAQDVWSF